MTRILIVSLFFFDLDCKYGGKKCHQIHVHAVDDASNNNNNTTNVNNNQKLKRQYTISEDGPTISEDDLDNLINQSINEWQQRQKNNNDSEKSSESVESSIDIDLTQSAPIIS